MLSMNANGQPAAPPATADELLALLANAITPALAKIHDAAVIAEESYRTNASLRTGFGNPPSAEDGVASLLYYLREAIGQVRKIEKARG